MCLKVVPQSGGGVTFFLKMNLEWYFWNEDSGITLYFVLILKPNSSSLIWHQNKIFPLMLINTTVN